MVVSNPYTDLRKLTDSYFDLSTKVFLDDLIEHHLEIKPKYITKRQLKRILIWVEIAASLIIEDQKKVQSYISKVKKLAEAK